MLKPIKVKILYRNYRPLHSMFATYKECPPAGVIFDVPNQKSNAKLFEICLKIYKKFSDLWFMKWLIANLVDPFLFGSRAAADSADEYDILHFLNMVPSRTITNPYVVEFEHVSSLFGFSDSKKQINHAKNALLNPLCKGIICSSAAAEATLKELFASDFSKVKDKAHIIYPAVCADKVPEEYTARPPSKKLNLLFVGNSCYVKGLEEVLIALEESPDMLDKIHLDIISDDAHELVNEHPKLSDVIKLYKPNFSKKEILERFFSVADLFLMPTKRDTFGFAVIDALTCGVPVVGTRQFAIPEMIEHKVDGLLIDLTDPVLDRTIYINRKLSNESIVSNPDKLLIKGLRQIFHELGAERYPLEEMGRKALKKVQPGATFSSSKRNKQLRDIYEKIQST